MNLSIDSLPHVHFIILDDAFDHSTSRDTQFLRNSSIKTKNVILSQINLSIVKILSYYKLIINNDSTWNYTFFNLKSGATYDIDLTTKEPKFTFKKNNSLNKLEKRRFSISAESIENLSKNLDLAYTNHHKNNHDSVSSSSPFKKSTSSPNFFRGFSISKRISHLLMRLEADVGWEVQLHPEKTSIPPPSLQENHDFPRYIPDPRKGLTQQQRKNGLFLIGKFPTCLQEIKKFNNSHAAISNSREPNNISQLVNNLFSFAKTLASSGLPTNYQQKQTKVSWINLPTVSSSNNKEYQIEQQFCSLFASAIFSFFGGVFYNSNSFFDPEYKLKFDAIYSSNMPTPASLSSFLLKLANNSYSLNSDPFTNINHTNNQSPLLNELLNVIIHLHLRKLQHPPRLHTTLITFSNQLHTLSHHNFNSNENHPSNSFVAPLFFPTLFNIDSRISSDPSKINNSPLQFLINVISEYVSKSQEDMSNSNISKNSPESLTSKTSHDLDNENKCASICIYGAINNFPTSLDFKTSLITPTPCLTKLDFNFLKKINISHQTTLIASNYGFEKISRNFSISNRFINTKNNIILSPTNYGIYKIYIINSNADKINFSIIDTSYINVNTSASPTRLNSISNSKQKRAELTSIRISKDLKPKNNTFTNSKNIFLNQELSFNSTTNNKSSSYNHDISPKTGYSSKTDLLHIPSVSFIFGNSVNTLLSIEYPKKLIHPNIGKHLLEHKNLSGTNFDLFSDFGISKKTALSHYNLCPNKRISLTNKLSNPHNFSKHFDAHCSTNDEILVSDSPEIDSIALNNSSILSHVSKYNHLAELNHKRVEINNIESWFNSYYLCFLDPTSATESTIRKLLLSPKDYEDAYELDDDEFSSQSSSSELISDFFSDIHFLESKYLLVRKNAIQSVVGNSKNNNKDKKSSSESILNSVMNQEKSLEKLIDSLLERNGYIVPKAEKVNPTSFLSNYEPSPFNDSATASPPKSLFGIDHSSSRINNLMSSNITKRKSTPKKIIQNDSSKSTEFLISPKKDKLKNRYLNLSISNSNQANPNKLISRVFDSADCPKSLLRRSSANLLSKPDDKSSPKDIYYNPSSVRKVRTYSSFNSLSSLSSSRLDSIKKTTKVAGRRSSGKNVQDLKLKLKNEVLISTSTAQKIVSSTSNSNTKSLSASSKSASSLSLSSRRNSGATFNIFSNQNKADSPLNGENDDSSINYIGAKRLSNRLFSAPNFLSDSSVEATAPIINRRLRRQGRNSSAVWISNIVNSCHLNNDNTEKSNQNNQIEIATLQESTTINMQNNNSPTPEKRTPKRSNTEIEKEPSITRINQRTQFDIKKNKLQRTF
ncbi:hypothetical protein AYI69_g1371 [Smittium culicis]|uniref:Uncharacterized protein n=1 Tax=Smittium culicis TaxID=133412 RepID=A0A1R1YQH3_9FUNG|nr:hypothetical protein AYI69_g1371 [Smittium culicis]